MKKKDLKTFRDKDINLLKKEVAQRKKKLGFFIPSLYAGREQNVKVGWNLRREIAQISSILQEKGENK